MKILLTNIVPKKSHPTLGLPPPGGGGGEGDYAEGTQNFQKGRQASPPWGRVSKPLKKGLVVSHCNTSLNPALCAHLTHVDAACTHNV